MFYLLVFHWSKDRSSLHLRFLRRWSFRCFWMRLPCTFLPLILTFSLVLFKPIPICSQHEINIFIQRLSDLHTRSFPECLCVWHISQLLIVKKTAIGCLDCIRERNADPTKHYSAGCCLLKWVYFEDAGVIAKHRSSISKQFWEKASLIVKTIDYGELRTVHECVFLSWMAVKVQKHQQLIAKHAFVLGN